MQTDAQTQTQDETCRIKVWDLPVRLFHWGVVAVVLIAAATGFFASADWLAVHVIAGLAMTALIVFRLAWAFFGSGYARLETFLFGPRRIFAHLLSLLRREPERHLGHNPAGSAMIYVLVLALVGLAVTGVLVMGGVEKLGPLKGYLSFAGGRAAKEAHETLALFLMGLAALHVVGVFAEIRLTGENILRAMINGWKERRKDQAIPVLKPARPLAASLVFVGIIAGIGVWAAQGMARPALGWRGVDFNPVYAKECGACHEAFHPSLLPAASWRSMMAQLSDHFGEDASLADAQAGAISDWLAANAAETFDTKAGNVFRRVNSTEPLRITQTRFWLHKHEDISKDVFARKAVGSKLRCAACHQDAAAGLFSGMAIRIPKEKIE